MPTTMTSALFLDQAAAIADMRALLSLGAAQYFNASALTDDMLWDKLMAAESEGERLLRVFFNPTQVIPDNAPAAEIAALEAASTRYVTTSNYDYDPDLFLNDAWGFIQLSHKPIQSIASVIIAFPTPFLQNYQVPADWLRLDRKYGHLQFVPTSTAQVTPVGAYAIAMWGGSIYPQAIQIRYLCGLTNADGQVVTSFAPHWNDLVDVIKRMAILRILKSVFLPSSSSISADGLSQSNSFKLSDWQDSIDETLFGPKGSNGGLYASIHGVTTAVG
jgi:hypothetical protein